MRDVVVKARVVRRDFRGVRRKMDMCLGDFSGMLEVVKLRKRATSVAMSAIDHGHLRDCLEGQALVVCGASAATAERGEINSPEYITIIGMHFVGFKYG